MARNWILALVALGDPLCAGSEPSTECLHDAPFVTTYQMLSKSLGDSDRQQWRNNGFVLVPRARWLGETDLDALASAVEAQSDDRVMNTYEDVKGTVKLSRTEGFADEVAVASAFLRHGPLAALAHELAATDGHDEGVALYTEKLVYKKAGGSGGYKAHQDKYASPVSGMKFDTYICMVAVDDFTRESGCPQLGWKAWQRKEGNVKDKGPFESIEMSRGDVLCYDGNLMPYMEEPNDSNAPRRALFGIYNPRNQGDFHQQYDRRERRAHTDGTGRSDDTANWYFTGKTATAPGPNGAATEAAATNGDQVCTAVGDGDGACSPPPTLAEKELVLGKIVAFFEDENMHDRRLQLRRSLQMAKLAEDAGADDATVVAALLSDLRWKQDDAKGTHEDKMCGLAQPDADQSDTEASSGEDSGEVSHRVKVVTPFTTENDEEEGNLDLVVGDRGVLDEVAEGWWLVRFDQRGDEGEGDWVDEKDVSNLRVEAKDATTPLVSAQWTTVLGLCEIVDPSDKELDAQYARIGAMYLRMLGFAEKVPHLVEGRALAERYLSHAEPAYLAKLGNESAVMLDLQGGPMSIAEAEQFRQGVQFEACMQMLRWDQSASQIDCSVPPFAHYVERLLRVMVHKPTSDDPNLLDRRTFLRDGTRLVEVRSVL